MLKTSLCNLKNIKKHVFFTFEQKHVKKTLKMHIQHNNKNKNLPFVKTEDQNVLNVVM